MIPDSERRDGGRGSEDRLEIVNECVKAFVDDIKSWSVYSAITKEAGEGEAVVVIELHCTGPGSRMADVIFHGSDDAHDVNSTIFVESGFEALYHVSEKIPEGMHMCHKYYLVPDSEVDKGEKDESE